MRSLRWCFSAALVLLFAVTATSSFAQQSGYYVLDGFGGVHAGGGAPVMSPQTPYFGFDIAKDIAYVPPNPGAAGGIDGIIVLDGFGGVYAGGGISGSPLTPITPYFGFDVARAVAMRSSAPPRINGFITSAASSISSTSYVSVGSVSIYAPRSGILLLNATGEVYCTGTGNAVARFSFNVDSTSPYPGIDYPIGIADCNATTGPTHFERVYTFTAPFSVSAGSHTVHLLVKNDGSSLNPVVSDRTMSVLFID